MLYSSMFSPGNWTSALLDKLSSCILNSARTLRYLWNRVPDIRPVQDPGLVRSVSIQSLLNEMMRKWRHL